MNPILGIDVNFMQINSCKNIKLIKCNGLKLYGYKDDESFTQWLVQNLYKKKQDRHLFY
jgi:hypothetical protein